MVSDSEARSRADGYGPRGFAAALMNILVIEFIAWALMPWVYLIFFLAPLLILDFAVSVFLATRRGTLCEIGRGMLIGCIAGPTSLVFFVPMYLLVAAVV